MTKSLIVGGAGFIGAHLASVLAVAGEAVDVLDNFARGVRDPFLDHLSRKSGVRVIDADMLNASTLSALDTDYDVIYQLAAIIGVRHVLERPYEVLCSNVEIQANAIALARRQKALTRFVFASTSEVYAGSLLHMEMPVPTPESYPLALTDLAQPRTSYMLSKIYGEAMCQHAGIPFTIVRPHNVYGPRMGLSHVIPELMQKALSLPHGGKLPVASVEHRRAFCYIDDAIAMLRSFAASPGAAGQTFNLGNQQHETNIGELAKVVLRAVRRTDLQVLPLPETAGSPARRCPDMELATRISGLRPAISLEEGVKRTYAWYASNVFASGGISAT